LSVYCLWRINFIIYFYERPVVAFKRRDPEGLWSDPVCMYCNASEFACQQRCSTCIGVLFGRRPWCRICLRMWLNCGKTNHSSCEGCWTVTSQRPSFHSPATVFITIYDSTASTRSSTSTSTSYTRSQLRSLVVSLYAISNRCSLKVEGRQRLRSANCHQLMDTVAARLVVGSDGMELASTLTPGRRSGVPTASDRRWKLVFLRRKRMIGALEALRDALYKLTTTTTNNNKYYYYYNN